jgi:NAD(P)-dependent dehydrogenase (short-subunit alcohol dehydrogenase family)
MNKVLKGRGAIITGASQGLGFEIAKKYILEGADVFICARNQEMLNRAYAELTRYAEPGQEVISQVADISCEADVKNIVGLAIKTLKYCTILVNNAGIYGPKGEIESVDWLEWMKAIEINVYGSVLMSREVLPHFKRQGYGKVIQLSGGGATNPLPRISAYAVSKAAIVRFAETLAEEVRGTGIDVNAIAPGALNTRMLDEVLAAGPKLVGNDFYERSVLQKKNGGAHLDSGAELAVFLASAESDGITGKLISASWDNWKEWTSHLDELRTSDIYTLRRIVGKDRGMLWGDK